MNILGIHDGHNASAALLQDGKLTAIISEERFTYKKNEMGFPEHAVRECLRLGGIEGKDIDAVGFSVKSIPIHYLRTKRECLFTIEDHLDEQELYWKPLLFEKKLNTQYIDDLVNNKRFQDPQAYKFDGIPNFLSPEENLKVFDRLRRETVKKLFGINPDVIKAYDHHDCHKYYAYFGSPYRKEKTLVFTSDGGGDGANGTVSIVENDRFKELGRNNVTDLGRIYRYITLILGMRISEHEFKVMGLAPYTSEYEIKKCEKAFKDIFHVPNDLIEYKNRPSDLYFHFRKELRACRFDGIAGAVQRMVEEVGLEWFSKVTKKYGISRVVFSGGLSMNVKLNKLVSELDSVDEFYCAASGGDESCSLGAAYLAHTEKSDLPVDSIEDAYLGPQNNRQDILRAVSKLKNCTITENVTNKEIAQLLAKGVVVGRCSGRMEFGARSLGNRSILANPTTPSVVKKINEQIKFRDFWMPFAPTVLDKYVKEYLINPKNMLSDHMTTSFDTTEKGKKCLAGAIHSADYTARAQILRRELNPSYYDLIEEFAKLTGVGALLNTSFNLHGLPVVCRPENAVHVFENSKLDAMVLEDVLILRDDVKESINNEKTEYAGAVYR